jgi:phospholipase D1/2
LINFLSVSCVSFVYELSPSLIEAQLNQRIANRSTTVCNLLYCKTFQLFYEKRWFCLKDTYLLNLNLKSNNSIEFIMLVDHAFECKKVTRLNFYYGIKIVNTQSNIYIKCNSYQQQLDWFEKINFMLQEPAGKSFKEQIKYDSFAPARTNQLCKWYLNGEGYMEAVMNGLNNAKEEIFIADWWLSPELFLKRPTDDVQYRLDKILLKKAKEGVKIYILLYKEVAIVHDLMSLRTKHVLTEYGKNQNIKVLRHPEHFIDGVFLWSHHEKCVIIDQSVAFTGGIDLCFGRWDDDTHR